MRAKWFVAMGIAVLLVLAWNVSRVGPPNHQAKIATMQMSAGDVADVVHTAFLTSPMSCTSEIVVDLYLMDSNGHDASLTTTALAGIVAKRQFFYMTSEFGDMTRMDTDARCAANNATRDAKPINVPLRA